MRRVFYIFFILFLIILFSSFVKTRKRIEVTPLPGTQYFDTLAISLANAKKTIIIVMFEFLLSGEKGRGPDSIFNLLLNAVKRGVEVKVILEGGEKYLGKKFTNRLKNTALKLKEGGVKVYLEREGVTTHTKMVIVDGKELFLGSSNWTFYGLNKNNESNVLIRSKKIAKFFEKYTKDIMKESIPYSLAPDFH